MNRYTSVDKKTKKARKAYYAARRKTWEELNPVTRVVPDGKAYNRKKQKQEDRKNGSASYLGDTKERGRFSVLQMIFEKRYLRKSVNFRIAFTQ